MGGFQQQCRVLLLLLYKNFLVRKRHWIGFLFFLILVPVGLIILPVVYKTSDSYHNWNETVYEYKPVHLFPNDHLNFYFASDKKFPISLDYVKRCLNVNGTERIHEFNSTAAALEEYSKNNSTGDEDVMVFFKKDSSPEHLKYTIRMEDPQLGQLYRYFIYNPEDDYSKPFIKLQFCLDLAFISEKLGTSFEGPGLFLRYMPSFASKTTKSYAMQIELLPPALLFAFMSVLIYEVDFVPNERTNGVHVLMAMNGVTTCKNLMSWFVSSVLLSPVYTIPISILLTLVTFQPNIVDPYFPNFGGFWIWLFFSVHTIHLLSFGMHIASYLSRPMFVKIAIFILSIGSLTIQFKLPRTEPYIGIVFPIVLQKGAFLQIVRYEGQMERIGWNIFKVQDPRGSDSESFGMMLVFSLLGSIFHFFMAVYVQEIKPGKYGVARHPLYFLKCLRKTKNFAQSTTTKIDYSSMEGKPFEPAPETFVPGIQIRNLKKSYSNNICSKASVQALKGVSVDFYENHITSLLGHNGAGKSTLMSILTGMTSPSDGTVLVNGKNISKDLDVILHDVGFCPQENMLFPDLSVFEHLVFFGMLQRSSETKATISENAEALLQKLNFSEKRDILPAKLSGGQKRRVCLGMALIGDPKILILDEPTSGMDPESRRDVWDVILGLRTQKTILISTHDMEEANVLGDRIAILHFGTLRCDGSPIFLKKLYGRDNMEVILSTRPGCNPKMVLDTLNPNGRINNADGPRLELNVPSSRNLPDALDSVEARKQELGVDGMSVSLITLEQIFLKITTECNDSPVAPNAPLTDSSEKVSGSKLTMQRMFALLAKKFTYTIKNPVLLLATTMIPLIGIWLVSAIFAESNIDMTETQICLSMYENPQTLSVSSENETYSTFYDKFAEEQGSKIIIPSANTGIIDQLMNIGKRNRVQYLYNVIAAAEFNGTEYVTAMIPNEATFGLPISINLVTNTILKNYTNDSHKIDVYFQTLPRSQETPILKDKSILAQIMFSNGLICSNCFFMTTFFAIHAKREAANGIKDLQLMTGVSPISYWGMMFIFDFLVISIVGVTLVIGMIILGMISGSAGALIYLLLFLLFSANVLPMLYMWSFSKLSNSAVMTIMGLLPIVPLILESIIHKYCYQDGGSDFVYNVLEVILHVIPQASYYEAIVSYSYMEKSLQQCENNSVDNSLCTMKCPSGTCRDSVKSYFDSEICKSLGIKKTLTKNVVQFCGTFILYVALLMMLEYRVIPKLLVRIRKNEIESTSQQSDKQVLAEKKSIVAEINKINRRGANSTSRSQVEDGEICDDENERNLFLAYKLSKRYGNVLAVREVNFRVKQGECFGLLDINGAGKSTTFKMLTGEEIPNTGSMYLNGKNLRSNRSAYLTQIGYCPQHSAIIESLNAIDHLRLFARLRGIPRSRVDSEVDHWINEMNLEACAARPAGTYSGGNKRRLNIAIAMIGNPTLVWLDEPTAGIDPGARRLLWNVIASCQANGQSVILTTHSMEECEALCGRIVIMAKGELLCIGPTQQLKQSFGAGFDILINIQKDQSGPTDIADLKSNMTTVLPCELTDENSSLLVFHVDGKLTWRALYDAMNDIKEHHPCVIDFSIISATLEQLFLKFAKEAKMGSTGP